MKSSDFSGRVFFVAAIFCWLLPRALGDNVSFDYDSLSRLTKVDYGNGSVITYTYDAAGNRLSHSATSGAPVITSALTASAQVGVAYSYAIVASNSPTEFSATGLPQGLNVNTTTGVISGTPAAPDTFPIALGATNGAGTGTATLTLTVAAPDFISWQQAKFTSGELSNASVSGPNAVYGHDGLPNLVKYALGLEPKQNVTTGLPAVTTTATDWVYTYTRPNDRADVTYAVEISTDLATWTTSGIVHEIVSSSGGTETWRARYPLASAANVYFRLKVTQP